MIRRLLTLTALLALGSPALAQHCAQPYAPDVSVTPKSSKQDLLQLRDDVQSFIQASDQYQQCLIKASKAASDIGGKLETMIAANQKDKQRVGDAFNAAVKAFNTAHPNSDKLADAKN